MVSQRYKMLSCVVAFALALSFVSPALALTGEEIRALLSGNSIVSPDFGCLHFKPDGTTFQVYNGGIVADGIWGVRGDVYTSSGSCGTIGCTLDAKVPIVVFNRVDGGYNQSAQLVEGNFCEKNGIIS